MAQHPRYGHPLRFYTRPHFTKCGAVAALKLRLVPRTAARPRGFMKQALCKVASAPASGVHRPGFWPGASRSIPASGLRPGTAASPRPPPGPRRCAALARAACPSAPQGGSLSPRNPHGGLRPPAARAYGAPAGHDAMHCAARRRDSERQSDEKKPGKPGFVCDATFKKSPWVKMWVNQKNLLKPA